MREAGVSGQPPRPHSLALPHPPSCPTQGACVGHHRGQVLPLTHREALHILLRLQESPGEGWPPAPACPASPQLPLTSALCSFCTNSAGGVPVTFMISFSWSRSGLSSGAHLGDGEQGHPTPTPHSWRTPRGRGAGATPIPTPHSWRIRSLPLNSVLPVIISAMMQPADQMSTERGSRQHLSPRLPAASPSWLQEQAGACSSGGSYLSVCSASNSR